MTIVLLTREPGGTALGEALRLDMPGLGSCLLKGTLTDQFVDLHGSGATICQ